MKKNNKTFIGSIQLTLKGGEKRNVRVYRKGNSILLSDHSIHDILVHPSNTRTQEGWIKEYELVRNVVVKKYEFGSPVSNEEIPF